MYICMYVCLYVYVCMFVYVCVYAIRNEHITQMLINIKGPLLSKITPPICVPPFDTFITFHRFERGNARPLNVLCAESPP